jgi:hypothetical protein
MIDLHVDRIPGRSNRFRILAVVLVILAPTLISLVKGSSKSPPGIAA